MSGKWSALENLYGMHNYHSSNILCVRKAKKSNKIFLVQPHFLSPKDIC